MQKCHFTGIELTASPRKSGSLPVFSANFVTWCFSLYQGIPYTCNWVYIGEWFISSHQIGAFWRTRKTIFRPGKLWSPVATVVIAWRVDGVLRPWVAPSGRFVLVLRRISIFGRRFGKMKVEIPQDLPNSYDIGGGIKKTWDSMDVSLYLLNEELFGTEKSSKSQGSLRPKDNML